MSDQNPTRPTPSSIASWVEILPDPAANSAVLRVAIALYAFGVLLLFQTRLGWLAESSLAAVFSALCAREWRCFRRRLTGVKRLRVHADGAVAVCRDGVWRQGRLAAGSVLLGPYAWLRVADDADDGARVDCVCCKRSSGERAWRRFLVIYRHVGGVI